MPSSVCRLLPPLLAPATPDTCPLFCVLPSQVADDELAAELGALSLDAGAHGPLRGLPTPAGTHIRLAGRAALGGHLALPVEGMERRGAVALLREARHLNPCIPPCWQV